MNLQDSPYEHFADALRAAGYIVLGPPPAGMINIPFNNGDVLQIKDGSYYLVVDYHLVSVQSGTPQYGLHSFTAYEWVKEFAGEFTKIGRIVPPLGKWNDGLFWFSEASPEQIMALIKGAP